MLTAVRQVIDEVRDDLVLATYSLLGIAPRLSADKPARPKLLLDPVRAAVDRGVGVHLLLRGRNIGEAERRSWKLVRKNDRWSIDKVSTADQSTAATLESGSLLGTRAPFVAVSVPPSSAACNLDVPARQIQQNAGREIAEAAEPRLCLGPRNP